MWPALALAALSLLPCAAPQPLYVLNASAFSSVLGEDLPWALANFPFFESSDANLTLSYYFRLRVLKFHVHATNVSELPYVITEFAPTVPWAGRANAIPCAAGHQLAEARWLRGANGTAIADSATAWWFSGLPGIELNYFTWHTQALLRGLEVRGAAGLPRALALLPNASAILSRYLAGQLPPNARYDAANACVWNSPGDEGQENAISGPGCRPLVQALLAGEARAMAALCSLAGNATCAAAFTAAAGAFQAALLRLWSPSLGFFATLQGGKPGPSPPPPPPPPGPLPPGFAPYRAGVFCCDQAPCEGGHSRFLYEGSDAEAACLARCSSGPLAGRCRFATVQAAPSAPWCQLAQYCNATNPWSGGAGTVTTYAYTPAQQQQQQLADVRELASLTSPWYFGAIPAANASAYAGAWEQVFDAEGLGGAHGVRTAEARHAGYGCFAGGCCEWGGPVWPFETAKLLGAAIAILQTPALAAAVPALTRPRLALLLGQYVNQHLDTWYISDGAGVRANYSQVAAAGLFFEGTGTAWIAEAGCAEDAQWTDRWREGYRYLHSSFLDLVLSGVAGLQPAAASEGALGVAPLQVPAGQAGAPAWWCADGVAVGGRAVTVLWDETGARYGRGAGLSVLLEGKLVAHSADAQGALRVQL
jgi:hypothetical protein